MRRLIVFNNLTLNGYFTGIDGDFAWAHAGGDDREFEDLYGNLWDLLQVRSLAGLRNVRARRANANMKRSKE